jgi:hypothetical protein
MVADDFRQSFGVGLLARQRGDVVRCFGRRLVAAGPLTLDAADLLDAGPIEMVVERDGGCQGAAFQAAVSLADLGERLPFGFAFMLGVGGKRPPERR